MKNIKQASLQDIRRMKNNGELRTDHGAKAGDELPADFWASAVIVEPGEAKSVRLNLEPEVFEFFKNQGKGHITRMQQVLKMYALAHSKGSSR